MNGNKKSEPEVRRFIITTDKRTGKEISRVDLGAISKEEGTLLMKAVIEQGLARAGFEGRGVK